MSKTNPTVDVTFDLGTDLQDPSGGAGMVKPIVVTPETFEVQEQTTIQFIFANDPGDAQFTAFRYFNTSQQYWNQGWFRPKGSVGVGSEGSEFENLVIARGGKSMTVVDKSNNDTLYFYVVEWTQGGNTWVCDPKIKNQPGGN